MKWRGIDRGAGTKGILCHRTLLYPSLLLSPIDNDAARSRRRDADRALRLAAQPFERTLVVLEEVLERMKAPAVVLAQPLLLLLGEHVFQHHARLDRHTRQPLEAVPAFVRVGVLGLHATYDEHGLYANAEFIGFV